MERAEEEAHGIACHYYREGLARKEWMAGCTESGHNRSDILTKALAAGINRKRKVNKCEWIEKVSLVLEGYYVSFYLCHLVSHLD